MKIKKTPTLIYVAVSLCLFSSGCNSSTEKGIKNNSLSEVTQNATSCDNDTTIPIKEQFIRAGKEPVRKDSVTNLSIRNFSKQWNPGDYPILRILEIENCSPPLSIDFLKNSKCIRHIEISSCNDLASLNIPFKEFTSLRTLTISNSGNIPAEIFSCNSLEKLVLMENDTKNLNFEKLADLKNLEEISITGNDNLEPFFNGQKVGNLENLKRLEITNSRIGTIGEGIGKLTKLETVRLENNDLQQVDNSFCQLSQLVHLEIESNPLKHLPPCFGQLPRLKELYLNRDSIEDLPASFSKLNNLEKLYMHENKLEHFPEEVLKLNNIKDFVIISDKYKTNDSLYSVLRTTFDHRGVTYYIDKFTHGEDD